MLLSWMQFVSTWINQINCKMSWRPLRKGDDVEEMYEEISLDYKVSEVAEDSKGGEENTIDAEE